MKKLMTGLFLLNSYCSFSQSDSSNNPLTFSGYVETYYGYDLGQPQNHLRPAFVYSHNRHNEVNLNLGFVKAAYKKDKVRANLALMTGTYANANLAAEPGVLRNIFEANAGVKIAADKELWIDAGIFPSHIGFESAIGKDCYTLTRSMLADNSPYFESGAKISYSSNNQQWFISALVLNGWQRIQRIDGNNTPAFGHQVTYKPNSKITLNSSSFIGSDTPDSIRQMRYFHNFFAQFQLHEKFGLIVGFDMGAQQQSKGSDIYNNWYSPVLMAKYSPNNKLSMTVRGEYYSDENGVIINTGTANGFKTAGYSFNLDYNISSNAVWRIEAKGYSSKDAIFTKQNLPSAQNYLITTALAVSF